MHGIFKKGFFVLLAGLAAITATAQDNSSASGFKQVNSFFATRVGLRVDPLNMLFKPPLWSGKVPLYFKMPSVGLSFQQDYGNRFTAELYSFGIMPATSNSAFSLDAQVRGRFDVFNFSRKVEKHEGKWRPYASVFLLLGTSSYNRDPNPYPLPHGYALVSAFGKFGIGGGVRRKLSDRAFLDFTLTKKLLQMQKSYLSFKDSTGTKVHYSSDLSANGMDETDWYFQTGITVLF